MINGYNQYLPSEYKITDDNTYLFNVFTTGSKTRYISKEFEDFFTDIN